MLHRQEHSGHPVSDGHTAGEGEDPGQDDSSGNPPVGAGSRGGACPQQSTGSGVGGGDGQAHQGGSKKTENITQIGGQPLAGS